MFFSSKPEKIHFCFCHKISDGVNGADQEVEGKMQCDYLQFYSAYMASWRDWEILSFFLGGGHILKIAKSHY